MRGYSGVTTSVPPANDLDLALYSTFTQQLTELMHKTEKVNKENVDKWDEFADNFIELVGVKAGPNGNPPAVTGKMNKIFQENRKGTILQMKTKLNAEFERVFGAEKSALIKDIVNNSDIIDKAMGY